MRTFTAHSRAPAAIAWELLAQPDRWHEWAPHVRGARGLGEREVESGARGTVRLAGIVRVPARVTAKEDGRSWTWRVGPVTMVHEVRPRGDGCELAVTLDAPGPLGPALVVTYGPPVALLVRRLARVAERRAGLS